MSKTIRIIQYGIGPIGASIARLLLEKPQIELVGAIDIDPTKVGQDVGRVIQAGRDLGVTVSNQATEVLKTDADLVIHSTSSYLMEVETQFLQCIEAGRCVLSTCEELSYPFHKHPQLSAKLDTAARQNGVTLLGTGINPGFLMDKLVLTLSAVCQRVERVEVTRIVDARQRRLPLQKKVGAGLTPNEFDTLVAAGNIRHHGLPESVAMIAAGLGFGLDDVHETIEPVIAPRAMRTDFLEVRAGQVAGVQQTAYGIVSGQQKIRLHLQMSVGAVNPRDEVKISGVPDVDCQFPGGIHGDVATAAIVVNCVPFLVGQARPGLLSSQDIPMCYFAGETE